MNVCTRENPDNFALPTVYAQLLLLSPRELSALIK